MLGRNHRVRKTPVSSRTMKLHRAISPSMKDQWSGKTLRRFFLASPASPSRSSAHSAAAPTLLGLAALLALVPLVRATDSVLIRSLSLHIVVALPEAGANGFGEVAGGDQVALGVHGQGQLWEVSGRGTEDDLAVVGEVEGRLVARAQQVVGLLLPQRDRAADVGADLGEAEDAVDTPVLAALPGSDVVGLHLHDDDRGLGLLGLQRDTFVDRLAVLLLEEHGRLAVDQLADLNVGRLDRGATDVLDDAHPLLPDGVEELVARQRTEVAQRQDRDQAEGTHRAEQRVADQRPTPDAGLLETGLQDGDGVGAVLVGGGSGVAVLDQLVVTHQLAGPLDHADADAQQRESETDTQRHVGGAEAEDLGRVVADLEDEVGDAEQQHEDRGEAEQGRDLSLRALLGVLVGVGRAGLVRGQARVCDGFGLGGGGLVLVDAHEVGFFLVERAGLAAIHTAKPTSAPMATSHAAMPSDTGPSEPSENPPYDGVASFFFR